MRFKIVFLTIISSLLYSCGDNGAVAPVVIWDEESTIANLTSIASQAQIEGELPDGYVVDFNPSVGASTLAGTNYTSVGSTSFSSVGETDFKIDAANFTASNGSLNIAFDSQADITVDFQYSLITTYGDLNDQFPELEIPREFWDYQIAYGLGSSQFDVEDIIRGNILTVTDYVLMISPPDRTDGFGLYFPEEPVTVESGEFTFTFFSLELAAEVAKFTNIEHSSFGDIRTFVGGDVSIKIGEFQLTLEE